MLAKFPGSPGGQGPQAEGYYRVRLCGREASDDRVEESLYRNALAGNTTAQIFWLKNRRPDRWRDVQHVDQAVGHYLISDRPMTEEEWITARADRAKTIESKASPQDTKDPDDTSKPLD
jgi:hypothetical protein